MFSTTMVCRLIGTLVVIMAVMHIARATDPASVTPATTATTATTATATATTTLVTRKLYKNKKKKNDDSDSNSSASAASEAASEAVEFVIVKQLSEQIDPKKDQRGQNTSTYSNVYLAYKTDDPVKKKFVIKEMSASFYAEGLTRAERAHIDGGSGRTERLEIEQLIASSPCFSGHPYIVNFVGSFDDGLSTPKLHYVVMEYVDAGSDPVGHMPWKAHPVHTQERIGSVLVYFRQLIAALFTCVAEGVAHRDLKLENLLCDAATNSIKVCDFGLSWIVREGATAVVGIAQTKVGSPATMAPEVHLRGQHGAASGYNPFSADLFSAGCVLYEMLIGEPLFYEIFWNRNGWSYRTLEREMERLILIKIRQKFPESSLKELLLGLLELNPARRWNYMRVLSNAWFRTGVDDATIMKMFSKETSKKIKGHRTETVRAMLA